MQEAEVDCASRLHVCRALCCHLAFSIGKQDIAEGVVAWNSEWPYRIAREAEGKCVHLDRDTLRCTVPSASSASLSSLRLSQRQRHASPPAPHRPSPGRKRRPSPCVLAGGRLHPRGRGGRRTRERLPSPALRWPHRTGVWLLDAGRRGTRQEGAQVACRAMVDPPREPSGTPACVLRCPPARRDGCRGQSGLCARRLLAGLLVDGPFWSRVCVGRPSEM